MDECYKGGNEEGKTERESNKKKKVAVLIEKVQIWDKVCLALRAENYSSLELGEFDKDISKRGSQN